MHSKPESKDTLGVHDLAFTQHMLDVEGMVPRKGKFVALKLDPSTEDLKRDDKRGGFYQKETAIKQFIDYCEKDH